MELRQFLDSMAQVQIAWFIAGVIFGAVSVGYWGRK